ncbi:MAG: hypothetical protein AAGF74_10670 [Pseudomonadota bacterium]
MSQVYVSITGLRLKQLWHAPRFWALAVPAMAEAQGAPGCLSASARTIRGVHHTLTVWESPAAMRRYLTMPKHLTAMKAFSGIATGKTIGYLADASPSWDEARAIWDRDGREYVPRG